MSFILDAIKKSEADRKKSQQADVYSLQEQEALNRQPHQRKSRWFLLSFAVLILALSGWFLWPAFLGYMTDFSPKTHLKAAPEIIIDASDKNKPSNKSTDTAAKSLPDKTFTIDDPLPSNYQIKELWEQPVSFQNMIPTLDFAFHVYSDVPDQRTIIINDRRLIEGQMIARGLKLHTISESGVILFYQDRFFHVDVVTQW